MDDYFCLSSQGISNFCGQNDFKFIVGGNIYLISKFRAAFLSPIVSKCMKCDPTFNEFEIDIPDDEGEFSLIIELGEKGKIHISDNLIEYLALVGSKLGNNEIIEASFSYQQKQFCPQDIIQRIISMQKYSHVTQESVNYASEHYFELQEEDLFSLDPNLLEKIILSDNLQIVSEDSLFHFLFNYVQEKGKESYFLLDFIRCEFLSSSNMEKFISLVSLENMTSQVWDSIKTRLLLPVSPIDNNDHEAESVEIIYNPEAPLDGIFSYLKKKYNGNVVERGLVSLDYQRTGLGNLSQITDSENTKHVRCYSFYTNEVFITFDFKEKRVNLSDYTIRTNSSKAENSHLKSWKIRGSNDGQTWNELDYRFNDDSLNSTFAMKKFHVKSNDETYQYLQLITDEADWDGIYQIYITNIEFYGTLFH